MITISIPLRIAPFEAMRISAGMNLSGEGGMTGTRERGTMAATAAHQELHMKDLVEKRVDTPDQIFRFATSFSMSRNQPAVIQEQMPPC